MIRLQQLLIGYRQRGHKRKVLSTALNFSASSGEMVAVIGPNGAGKSTLLRTIVRQHEPLEGNIDILGTSWHRYSSRDFARICSFVPTGQPPVSQLSVFEVTAMARYPYTGWGGRLKKDDKQAVAKALARVHLESMRDRLLGELSDGERQRALIARALAQDTPLILLDEPTAFLDIPNRYEVLQMMRRISQEQNKLFIFSSHDLGFILETADKIWLLYPGQAIEGAPEELLRDHALDTLFRNTDIHYDLHKGLHIPLQQRYHTTIRLTGDEDEIPWVEKALLRAGYPVSHSRTDNGEIHIEARKKNYRIWIKNQPEENFLSINSLILYLKNIQTGKA